MVTKEQYWKNPKKWRKLQADYRKSHPEAVKEISRKSYVKNKYNWDYREKNMLYARRIRSDPVKLKQINDRRRELRKDPVRNKRLKEQDKKSCQKQRSLAIELLGSKCKNCGDTKKLECHHIFYDDDNHMTRVYIEVINNPQKFWLLCKPCHRIVTLASLYPDKFKGIANILSIVSKHETIVRR